MGDSSYQVFEVVHKASLKKVLNEVVKAIGAKSYIDLCFNNNEINKFRAAYSDYLEKDSITTIFVKKELGNIATDIQVLGLEKKAKLNYYKKLLKNQNARLLVVVPKRPS